MAGLFDFFRRLATAPGAGEAVARLRAFVFQEIKRTWNAEDGDITEQENGFDWLPGSHKVHVRILPEENGDNPFRHRLSIATEFLRSVPSDGKTSVDIGTLAQAICPTFAPVRRTMAANTAPDAPTDLQFFASAYVDESTVGWLTGFLARMSMLQPFQAERHSDSFGKIFGDGAPAFATGSKRQTDNMVFLLDEILRSQSGATSGWIDCPEFEEFTQTYARNDHCFGMADESGMSLETPFGSDTALIRFEAGGGFPTLGEGLVVRTMIRSTDTREQICAHAAQLNHLEGTQWTDFPQLGCWHFHAPSEEQNLLAHSCFIPDMFFRDGLATNFGLWATARAQWARGILMPDVQSKTMREILEARFK